MKHSMKRALALLLALLLAVPAFAFAEPLDNELDFAFEEEAEADVAADESVGEISFDLSELTEEEPAAPPADDDSEAEVSLDDEEPKAEEEESAEDVASEDAATDLTEEETSEEETAEDEAADAVTNYKVTFKWTTDAGLKSRSISYPAGTVLALANTAGTVNVIAAIQGDPAATGGEGDIWNGNHYRGATTFAYQGWYLDDDTDVRTTNAQDASLNGYWPKTVNSPLTFYEGWGGTVKFYKNDGSGAQIGTDAIVLEGNKISRPADPTRTGYDFIGWSTNSTATTLAECYDFNATITGDTNLFGVWAAKDQTIKFMDESGVTELLLSNDKYAATLKYDANINILPKVQPADYTDASGYTHTFEGYVLTTDAAAQPTVYVVDNGILVLKSNHATALKVNGDMTFKAYFTSKPAKEVWVYWYDGTDNATLLTVKNGTNPTLYTINEAPEFADGTPTKDCDATYSYTFANAWKDKNGDAANINAVITESYALLEEDINKGKTVDGVAHADTAKMIRYYAQFNKTADIVAQVTVGGAGTPVVPTKTKYYNDLDKAITDAKLATTADKTVTLLNHATIARPWTITEPNFLITAASAFTITPSVPFSGAMFTINKDTSGNAPVAGKLTLNKVVVNPLGNCKGVVVNGGNLTMTGAAKIINSAEGSTHGVYLTTATDSLTITSGSIEGNTSLTPTASVADVYVAPGATATLTNGSVTNVYVDAKLTNSETDTYTGGVFDVEASGTVKNVYLAYRGALLKDAGIVSNLYTEEGTASSKVVSKTSEETAGAGITKRDYYSGTAVAKIEYGGKTTYYSDLATAITAAGANGGGKTVKLIRNVIVGATVVAAPTSAMTLDLDNYSLIGDNSVNPILSVTKTMAIQNGSITNTFAGAGIAVSGGSAIAPTTLTMSSLRVRTSGTAINVTAGNFAVVNVNDANTSITSTSGDAIRLGVKQAASAAEGGTVNISAGTVTGQTNAVNVTGTGKLNITGGTLSSATGNALKVYSNTAAGADQSKPVVYIESGATLTAPASAGYQVYSYAAQEEPLADVTLKAAATTNYADVYTGRWEDNKNGTFSLVKVYTVQFRDTTHGTTTPTQYVAEGKKIVESEAYPTYAGANFLGWDDTAVPGIAILDLGGLVVHKNYVLEAQWSTVANTTFGVQVGTPANGAVSAGIVGGDEVAHTNLSYRDVTLTYNNGYNLVWKFLAPEGTTATGTSADGSVTYGYYDTATKTWIPLSRVLDNGTVIVNGVARRCVTVTEAIDPDKINELWDDNQAGGAIATDVAYAVGTYKFAPVTLSNGAVAADPTANIQTFDVKLYPYNIELKRQNATTGKLETKLKIANGKKYFFVTFDPNGGSYPGGVTVDPIGVPYGAALKTVTDVEKSIPDPVLTGKGFDGWRNNIDAHVYKYKDATYALEDYPVTQDVTMTAQWATPAATVTVGSTVTSYASFDDALAAANTQNGATITLLAATNTAASTATVKKTMTIALNDKTLNLTGLLTVAGGATLTINGASVANSVVNGLIVVDYDSSTLTSGSLILNKGTYNSALTPVIIYNGNNASAGLTINGATINSTAQNAAVGGIFIDNGKGTFTITDSKVKGYAYGICMYGGELTLSGANAITGTDADANSGYAIKVYAAGEVTGDHPTLTFEGRNNTLTVDATVQTGKEKIYYREYNTDAELHEGAVITAEQQNMYTVSPDYTWFHNGTKWQVGKVVASATNVANPNVVAKFATLEQAETYMNEAGYDDYRLQIRVNNKMYWIAGDYAKTIRFDELTKLVKKAVMPAGYDYSANVGAISFELVDDPAPVYTAAQITYVKKLVAQGYAGLTINGGAATLGGIVAGAVTDVQTYATASLKKQTKDDAKFALELPVEAKDTWAGAAVGATLNVIYKSADPTVTATESKTCVVKKDTATNSKNVVAVEVATPGTFVVAKDAVAQVVVTTSGYNPTTGAKEEKTYSTVYGTFDDAIAYANAPTNSAGAIIPAAEITGITVTLLEDCTANSTKNIEKSMTLDLNGYTLEFTAGNFSMTTANTKFTINDSIGNGAIDFARKENTGIIVNAATAELVVNGGILKNADDQPIGIDSNGGKVTINGGTIEGNTRSIAVRNGATASITITGGKFAKALYTPGANVTRKITGGLFANNPRECYTDGGYFPTKNTDPVTKTTYPYAVMRNPAARMVAPAGLTGTVYYMTITDAIADVPNNGTGTISVVYNPKEDNGNFTPVDMDDQSLKENVVIPATKTINLDIMDAILVNATEGNTIEVQENATLYLYRSTNKASTAAKLYGSIDNTANGGSALLNNGTVVEGKDSDANDYTNVPTFRRTAEAGTTWLANGNNTAATIVNHNEMVLRNASVQNKGVYSPAVENSRGSVSYGRDETASLTIAGGTYTGGKDTVYNAPDSELAVTGVATFTAAASTVDDQTANTRSLILNEGYASISGAAVFKDTGKGYTKGIMNHSANELLLSAALDVSALKSKQTTYWFIDDQEQPHSETFAGKIYANDAGDDNTLPSGYAFATCPNYIGWDGGNYNHTVAVQIALNTRTGTSYGTLAEAINAAGTGDTIRLLGSVNTPVDTTAATGAKTFTLDLNGNNITNKRNSAADPGETAKPTINVTTGFSVTIVNSSATSDSTIDIGFNGMQALNNAGTVTIGQSSDTKHVVFTRSKETGADWATTAATGVAENTAATILNSGEMTVVYADASNNGVYSNVVTNTNKLYIYDGSFTGGRANVWNNNTTATVTITGGKFKAIDVTPSTVAAADRDEKYCTEALLVNEAGTIDFGNMTIDRGNEFTNIIMNNATNASAEMTSALTLETGSTVTLDTAVAKYQAKATSAMSAPEKTAFAAQALVATGKYIRSINNTLSLPAGYYWEFYNALNKYEVTVGGNAMNVRTSQTYATLAAAIAAASAGDTIKLLGTAGGTIEGCVTVDRNLSLDLNGMKLTNKASETKDTITVNAGVTLTIYDGQEDATVATKPVPQALTYDKLGVVDNTANGCAAIRNNGTVYLGKRFTPKASLAANYTADDVYYYGCTVTRSAENGIATGSTANTYHTIVNDGTLQIVNANVSQAAAGKLNNTIENNKTLTIDRGNFLYGKYTVSNNKGATATINDGKFDNISKAVLMNYNVANVKGGTLKASQNVIINAADPANSGTSAGALTITGNPTLTEGGSTYTDIAIESGMGIGTVRSSTRNYTIPSDYAWNEQTDGTFLMGGFLCAIGTLDGNGVFTVSAKYGTLADAVKAAGTTASTIQLVNNCENIGNLTIPAGANITLDLAGWNITTSGINTIGTLNLIDTLGPKIKTGNTYVLDGNATKVYGSIVNNSGVAITVQNTGTFTTELGSSSAGFNSKTLIKGTNAVKNLYGNMTLAGGMFEGTTDAIVIDHAAVKTATTTISITGGVFVAGSGTPISSIATGTNPNTGKKLPTYEAEKRNGFVNPAAAKDVLFNKTIGYAVITGNTVSEQGVATTTKACTNKLTMDVKGQATGTPQYYYITNGYTMTLKAGTAGGRTATFPLTPESDTQTVVVASGESFPANCVAYVAPVFEGYEFDHWVITNTTNVYNTSNAVYSDYNLTAGWKEKLFTVKFVDEADPTKELATAQTVQEGKYVTKPADPVKEGATLIGWYNGVDTWNFATYKLTQDFIGTGDTLTLTAKFNYAVKWNNEDGTSLGEDEVYAYNATPSYKGTQPIKAASEGHTYFFDGWDPAIAPVTAPATYKAKFSILAATVDGKPYKSFEEALEASKTASDPTITLTEPVAEPYKLAEGEELKVKGNEDGSKLTVVPADETKKILENTVDGVTTYTVVDKLVVTFDITPKATIEVAAGSTVAQVKDQFPKKEDVTAPDYYTFEGAWKVGDADLTDDYVFETDTTLTPVWVDTITWQPTLNLLSSIGVNWYIHLPATENAADYSVKVEYANEYQKVNLVKVFTDMSTVERSRGEEKVPFYGLTKALFVGSDELADVVTVTLLKKGEVVEKKEYSVQSIAAEKIADPTTPETQVTLYKALLQYGDNAQIMFNRNTDKPSGVTGAPALVPIPKDYEAKNDPTLKGIKLFEAKLALDSSVDMNVYLTLDGIALEDLTITVTDKAGNAASFTEPKMRNGKVYFKVQDIYSDQMSDDYLITVKTKDGSATWTRSLITCAYEMQQNNPDNTNLKNVLMAMYQYHLAAVEVFA